MRKVYVLGDANVDIIVPYPRFLNEERTLTEYPNPSLQGGGTSANTAVALARLGIPTAFVGTIGDDQYGKYIKSDFQKEGVDISGLISKPDLNTVGVFAFIDENGERYLWGWPREKQAFKELDASHVDMGELLSAAWIHSSGMSLVYDTSAGKTIIDVFRQAHKSGIPTSFDLNLRVDNGKLDKDYEERIREVIQYTTVLFGSGTDEFEYLGAKGWKENARQFAGNERTVIVRNGKKGSVGITMTGEEAVPAFRVNVVDTVGAGDVYNAGFIAAKLAGKSLRECLIFGNAVSGYTVERKGARGCPTKIEAELFLKKSFRSETELFGKKEFNNDEED